MKRFLTIVAAFALVLGLSQCKKPNMPEYTGPIGDRYLQHITVGATNGTGNNGDSKVAVDPEGPNMNLTWQEGDKLYVFNNGVIAYKDEPLVLSEGKDTPNGKFEGTIMGKKDDELTFIYKGNDVNLKDDGTFEIDYNDQTGSEDWLKRHLVLKADNVPFTPNVSDYNATLTAPYAILFLNLSYLGSTTKADDGATVTVKVDDNTIATIKNVKSSSTGMYVALPINYPNTEKAYVFSSTNGKTVKYSWKLDGNTYYTAAGTQGGSIKPVETNEWINFGLPEPYQNLKWAKKNIGADNGSTAQSWYGDYYAWGATTTWYEDGTASSPTWKKDYKFGYNMLKAPYYSNSGYTKYTSAGATLEVGDDVAHTSLGGSWRMPTSGEWQQLKDNTLFVWTDNYKDISNLKGYVVYKVKATAHKGQKSTSSGNGNCNYSGTAYALTDHHMFLPAAGNYDDKNLKNSGIRGCYWSSSLSQNSFQNATYMFLIASDLNPDARTGRHYGFSVRPVQ